MNLRWEREKKAIYFEDMYFNSNIYHRRAYHLETWEEYSDFVFVHSEAEAAGFPEDVIVGWPGDITPNMVVEINAEILRSEIDLEPFSLEYPITIENLVDDWKSIDDLLWYGMPSNLTREHIKRRASGFYDRYRENYNTRHTDEASGD